MHTIRYSSPAKLNLWLYVTGRRADGFHALDSLFARIALTDSLLFTPTGQIAPADRAVTLTCNDPSLPTDGSNLVLKAAAALAGELNRTELESVHIELLKKIPAGGGLGGGSSNAATTLRALSSLWLGQRLTPNSTPAVVLTLADRLGSDIRFFALRTAQAHITGRGEHVTPTRAWPFHAVLMCPPFGCPTADVFRAFAAGHRDALPQQLLTPADLWHADGTPIRPSAIATRLINMLTRAACTVQPQLAALLADVQTLAGRPVHMSGSGSTLFMLADDQQDVEVIAERLRSALTATATVVTTHAMSK